MCMCVSALTIYAIKLLLFIVHTMKVKGVQTFQTSKLYKVYMNTFYGYSFSDQITDQL